MAKRGGFIGQDGINAPDQATGVEASAGDTQASVSFTTPSDQGGADVTEYRVTDSTGAFGASGSSSPITVTGLTNGTSYTFNVWAINPFGWSSPSDASGSIAPSADKMLMGGGVSPSNTNVIQTLLMSSTGNTTDYGDLTQARNGLTACASSTRAVFIGGDSTNVIDFISFTSGGTATDFGDTRFSNSNYAAALSNDTRGVFAVGYIGSYSSAIDYITIASASNAVNFGDLSSNRAQAAGVANTTRGVLAGGSTPTIVNNIEYVTIATTSNSTDFGDLTQGRNLSSTAASNSTRGVFAGGQASGADFSDVIDYITIATTGNATDFGDLTVGRNNGSASAASPTRAVFGGGNTSGGYVDVIDYVTLASTGNAVDFGDMLSATSASAGCSKVHGGLS